MFGRTALALDGAEMWTMSHYGDFLERDNPGAGRTSGLEDIVASINAIRDDERDTSPHLSVTFSVDDPEVTAARATELGGKVIVPPFNAP